MWSDDFEYGEFSYSDVFIYLSGPLLIRSLLILRVLRGIMSDVGRSL